MGSNGEPFANPKKRVSSDPATAIVKCAQAITLAHLAAITPQATAERVPCNTSIMIQPHTEQAQTL